MRDMEELETMGQRLTAAREAHGLSRPELAKLVGLTRTAINQWENGTVKSIRPKNLVNVCDALNIEMRWLITGEGRRSQALQKDKRNLAMRLAAVCERLATRQLAQIVPMLEATALAQERGELTPIETAQEKEPT